MKKKKREQEIADIITRKGFVKVEELSSELYISQSSIRRDLATLEQKKLIKRVRGGAILRQDCKVLSPFYAREVTNVEQKRKIAQKASYLINDSMSVIIDGSTTAMQMLPYLQQYDRIRVFTNNVHTYLSALEMGLDAYCLGGGPSSDNEVLSGSITENSVKEIYADILFFSSKCVNENGDITDPIDSETRLRKTMLKQAKTKVFLYDLSKLGTTSLFKVCNLSDVDYSFTDE